MADAVIIAILFIVIWRALVSATKHFKGQGGCCGGGDAIVEHKKLEGKKIGQWNVRLEGMHCENCKKRVEHEINKIEGGVCKVNLKKKCAVIEYNEPIEETVIKDTIENLGYKVVEIRDEKG